MSDLNEPGPPLGQGELEQRLLDAARGERVPARLKEHMAAALPSAPIVPVGTPPQAGRALLRGLGTAKGGGWLAVSGLVVLSSLGLRAIATDPRPRAKSPNVASKSAPPFAAPLVAPPSPLDAIAFDPLAQEIALLDAARSALRAGDGSRALGLATRHQREFPRGTLAPEAEVLSIEALAQTGERARAAGRARAFLLAHADSPLAERVRRIAAKR
jgi:hypothetical protein